ncbi:BREX-1 system adenine-specific DNA-methyltransferase PglX [Alicyclobacillus mengziensis]|uniref:site-specific DNA-methyltransferase (adenine-specific) n=1 Tax=Alicyclobacillus mengziensis TaxID=2931921 RepID=A0A9X7W0U8_9BACL|nr:BREX-1 system adenine-specific DNA-methyltransferase PglX [Alicyclobacillus mengziensis]QSO48382.1 BREX-1 system adenine-specific DNA-methyltransferase PglX [Alicyclobacillus mengziensis]
MNKTVLKNFATSARNELIKKVEARALKIGITEESIKKAQFESSDAIYIDGKQLSLTEKKQRDKLIRRIREIGFKNVVEEVAYTWFNRFIALRFMEVNNYLPTKVRVLSSSEPGNPEPDIIKEALSVDLDIDKELVYDLKLNNKTEELFKYMVVKQCNDLNKYLSFMFETIEDYKEILFPEGLLAKESFLREMTDVTAIPESDWEQVEIIGWLYQYYIAEEKARVFREKEKHKKEEIPYVSQLFTPDWIVRYMVQNSLGRYWLELHPEDSELASNWEFYIEGTHQTSSASEDSISQLKSKINVEEIKCIDPAMGSGHVLVYMFDVLYQIYTKRGYIGREIPKLIIENNLFGLDIDDRATQLACFAVVMKAMEYNPRFLRNIERNGLNLNLISIQETNNLSERDISFIAGEEKGVNFTKVKQYVSQFLDAKIFGSLIRVHDSCLNFLKKRLSEINGTVVDNLFDVPLQSKIIALLPSLIQQTEIMRTKFDILVTNPPYIGSGRMNNQLNAFLRENYPDSKDDTCTAFMETDYLKEQGLMGMVNQNSWMFLSSYEQLRHKIIKHANVLSMFHLGSRAFEEIDGEVVQTTAFVIKNSDEAFGGEGTYVRLVDFKDPSEKELKALDALHHPGVDYRFNAALASFESLPCMPICYWISDDIRRLYKYKLIGADYELKEGVGTRNDPEFLRCFWEVSIEKIGREARWILTDKAGANRKWYMGFTYVMDWENDGYRIRNYRNPDGSLKSRPQNTQFLYKQGVTWGKVGSGKPSFRWRPEGYGFNDAAPTIFGTDSILLLGELNSKPFEKVLKIQGETINLTTGVVKNVPNLINEKIDQEFLAQKIKLCVEISKTDWDFFETSIEFKRHPFLEFSTKGIRLKDVFLKWCLFTEEQFNQLKDSEESLNKLFIDTYQLNELTPEVADEDISIRKANGVRDVKALVSYAVGCMFGRYSLDEEGIVFAGGNFESERYKTFVVDQDNIVPILSDEYFEDDIVSRFVEFVSVSFGEETLRENLEFIADTLGKKDSETPREAIRRYLLNDFFKDHLQTYKKKPIYWLFTSGKQKAFNCLIYMHRYDKTTLSRIRTDYVHELQMRYDAEKKSLLSVIEGDGTAREVSAAKKDLKTLELKIVELKDYEEVLHHMADQQIEIDLDDGVDVNFGKFETLLAKRG